MTTNRTDLIDNFINRRLEAIFPNREDAVKLMADTKPLTFYLGIDPTGSDVHLGHTIGLLVLKDLARLGHNVIVLIGDFTAQIGDPTGKEAVRKQLTVSEVRKNAETYTEQVGKIFREVPFEVRYNSHWLQHMAMEEIIKLASSVTVQQMIIRDMFQERIKQEKPIYLHEFLYPLMQGYDSVAMKVDGEVGGNDQTFNMLIGRTLVKQYLRKEKMVLASKLLVDPTTGKKMSKSEGTLIAVRDTPQEIRRKVLEIDDAMVQTVFKLCTEADEHWIQERGEALKRGENPRIFKEELAEELARMYHGDEAKKEVHESQGVDFQEGGIVDFLIAAGVTDSKAQAKQLVREGAVFVNGEKVDKWDKQVKTGDAVKAGKGRFFKVV